MKYPGSKLTILGGALVATPLIAVGLLWQTGANRVQGPSLMAPQVINPATEKEPMVIRVIVIRSPGVSEAAR